MNFDHPCPDPSKGCAAIWVLNRYDEDKMTSAHRRFDPV